MNSLAESGEQRVESPVRRLRVIVAYCESCGATTYDAGRELAVAELDVEKPCRWCPGRVVFVVVGVPAGREQGAGSREQPARYRLTEKGLAALKDDLR